MLADRARLLPVLVVLVLSALVAACGPASGSPSPSPAPSPTPAPSPIDSAEAAAERVLEQNPQFAGMEPLNPDMVGQCCWYETSETADGYEVVLRIGWGDCMAGCIERHEWTYAVSRDGQVTFLGEQGDPLPPDLLPGGGGGGGATGISGTVTAGPTCPVEQNSPDPNCLPRPVAGAVIIIRGEDGLEVGRVQSNETGLFTFDLPAGRYTLEPLPVEGLMGTPSSMEITVEEGRLVPVELDYDTGIR
jgi:hypothetical protein